MKTIGSILDQHKGFGPGFHYLRVALAILVVVWHVHYAYAGMAAGTLNLETAPLLWFPGYAILVMFFALGGFLITGSVMRLSLKDYAINRALRIMPALAVEVVLSVLILGPLFTVLPLSRYFSDYHAYLYATNIFGVVNYFLPGVFVGNPAPEVNNALWTIPFEYLGYAGAAVYALFGLTRRPWLILVCVGAFIAIGFALLALGFVPPDQYAPSASAPGLLAKLFSQTLFLGRGARLLIGFSLGVAAYLYRDRIVYDRGLFLAALALCFVVAAAGPAPWLSQPMLGLVAAPSIVYITLYFGVSDAPRVPLLWRGDYSYGVYLYGFPIQQAVRASFPETGPVTQFMLAMGPILLLAIFSWHFVEEPILRARRRFSLLAAEKGASVERIGKRLGAGVRATG